MMFRYRGYLERKTATLSGLGLANQAAVLCLPWIALLPVAHLGCRLAGLPTGMGGWLMPAGIGLSVIGQGFVLWHSVFSPLLMAIREEVAFRRKK